MKKKSPLAERIYTVKLALPFPDKSYVTLYADPPWPEVGGGRIKRGADAHYELMKVKDIIGMGAEVQRVTASKSHCYLWVTNNYLRAAFDVLDAWGYRYVTCVTWGKQQMGLGQYYRGQTEHCLFGVRNNIPYATYHGKRAQGRTLILAPRTEHSVKPPQMRQWIEMVSPGPYLELFARTAVPNWTAWGNEQLRETTLSFPLLNG